MGEIDMSDSDRSAHIGLIGDYASMTIKSVILSNSTAAGAVLVLLGSSWDKSVISQILPTSIEAIRMFAGGTFLAMVAAGISYLSQHEFLRGIDERANAAKWRTGNPEQAGKLEGLADCLYRRGLAFQIVAILLTLGGLICFAYGAWTGTEALSKAKGSVTDVKTACQCVPEGVAHPK